MTTRWYILQVYSGLEEKVAQALTENAKKEGVEDLIDEIFIPKETVKKVTAGKVVEVERKMYPGYLYVKIDLKDKLKKVIGDIPRVSGFLGLSKDALGRKKPMPISEAEIQKIKNLISNIDEKNTTEILFEVGEKVTVIDGPFESFSGFVEEVDLERARLKLSISIFNRETPVELEYHQVKKVVE